MKLIKIDIFCMVYKDQETMLFKHFGKTYNIKFSNEEMMKIS